MKSSRSSDLGHVLSLYLDFSIMRHAIVEIILKSRLSLLEFGFWYGFPLRRPNSSCSGISPYLGSTFRSVGGASDSHTSSAEGPYSTRSAGSQGLGVKLAEAASVGVAVCWTYTKALIYKNSVLSEQPAIHPRGAAFDGVVLAPPFR